MAFVEHVLELRAEGALPYLTQLGFSGETAYGATSGLGMNTSDSQGTVSGVSYDDPIIDTREGR